MAGRRGGRSMEQQEGRYLYGIGAAESAARLGAIGIEDSDVYTIPYAGLCAIVHDCPAQPYRSTNEETVKGWVRAHQRVLDEAKARFGAVIPFGFDTILQSKGKAAVPDQTVKELLQNDHDRLQTLL